MSSLKFESLKDDFDAISARLEVEPISVTALNRLNDILKSLESEGICSNLR